MTADPILTLRAHARRRWANRKITAFLVAALYVAACAALAGYMFQVMTGGR